LCSNGENKVLPSSADGLPKEQSIVGPLQAILSSVVSIFFYAMLVSAVWKLFQIGTELGEIKNILADIRRDGGNPLAKSAAPAAAAAHSTPAATPAAMTGPISLESAEALLREVAAESQALSASERQR
jgi:hypothetical protein